MPFTQLSRKFTSYTVTMAECVKNKNQKKNPHPNIVTILSKLLQVLPNFKSLISLILFQFCQFLLLSNSCENCCGHVHFEPLDFSEVQVCEHEYEWDRVEITKPRVHLDFHRSHYVQ